MNEKLMTIMLILIFFVVLMYGVISTRRNVEINLTNETRKIIQNNNSDRPIIHIDDGNVEKSLENNVDLIDEDGALF